jgi:hypothetical protein
MSQFAGPITFSYTSTGTAFFVQLEFHLVAAHFQRAIGHAVLAQYLAEAMQGVHFVLEFAFATVDQGLGIRVGEAARTAHDGAPEPFGQHLGFFVQLEDGAEAELVLVRIERAEVVAEPLG